jgi:hypothetical protein
MKSIDNPFNKILDSSRKISTVFSPKNAAAGDTPNEKIKRCYVCKNSGWPHEAIAFERVLGRVLSDGNNETKGWIIRDYFTGQIHRHRSNKQE